MCLETQRWLIALELGSELRLQTTSKIKSSNPGVVTFERALLNYHPRPES